jgi:hypothetical protein
VNRRWGHPSRVVRGARPARRADDAVAVQGRDGPVEWGDAVRVGAGDTAGVRLTARDGAWVELRPLRYEFGPSERDDWDRNWLVVRGDVHTPDGLSWSFTHPCLTTWEARQLATWLRAAACGDVAPSPTPPDEDDHGLQAFTEPNVAVSVATVAPDQVGLRLHLSLESVPPGHPQGEPFHLVLQIAPGDLQQAADAWERDLEPFPER